VGSPASAGLAAGERKGGDIDVGRHLAKAAAERGVVQRHCLAYQFSHVDPCLYRSAALVSAGAVTSYS